MPLGFKRDKVPTVNLHKNYKLVLDKKIGRVRVIY
jgi:hypothetical protein